jgi:hypothetical protein
MDNISLENGMKNLSSAGQIITQEEFDALIFELSREVKLDHVASVPNANDKLKKLEFNMIVLVGLILLVLILCHNS